jgi:hypothetical protein
MRKFSSVVTKLLVVFLTSLAVAQNQKPRDLAVKPASVTVPLYLEDNRVFVDLTFTRPDGQPRNARCWVDTGGGGFSITEPLARELGLDVSGKPHEEQGSRFVDIKPPEARLGNMVIQKLPMAAILGQKTIDLSVRAECFIPAPLLKKYDVVIDYPARQFTLARPGTVKPRGVRLVTPVNPQSGFVRLEAIIAGKSYGFLLDTGAAYSMISQAAIDQWTTAHADWPRATGAVGAANMIGRAFEADLAMMRLPEIAFEPVNLSQIGVVARPTGTFEKWMSSMMTAPIVGAIAGNILRAFRVQIDYAHGVTYLEQTGKLDPNDLDVAGLLVQPKPDGSYLVSGVAKKNGKEVIEGVAAGDKLLQIDGAPVSGKALAEVLDALRGRPGEIRTVVLERNGKQFTISAPVIHLL